MVRSKVENGMEVVVSLQEAMLVAKVLNFYSEAVNCYDDATVCIVQ